MTHARNDGNISDKDEARTPQSLFKKLDDRFSFDIDVCASDSNHLCTLYYTKEHDALKQNWSFLHWPGGYPSADPQVPADPISTVFCQPPYSNPSPFIQKAAEESLKGVTVVMLIPADTACKAFHKYIMGVDILPDGTQKPNEFGASEIIFLIPRVTFNNPDGTPMNGSPKFGSMVVVFKQEDFDGSPVISSMRWRD